MGQNVLDCAGNCNGTAVIDECGTCGGAGIPEGECNCGGWVNDCENVCGGTSTTDQCGVCNGDGTSCTGCTDPSACNYEDTKTIDNGSCTFAAQYYDCNNNCIHDSDGDGTCDHEDTCDSELDQCGV